jgi:malate/lactate dehydrogenase
MQGYELMNPKKSQLAQIQADLLAGKPVNSVVAFECYHITRLSSIIKRLRDKGCQIITTQEQGNGIAHYSPTKHEQA